MGVYLIHAFNENTSYKTLRLRQARTRTGKMRRSVCYFHKVKDQEEEKVRDKYWKNKNKKKCGQIPAFGNWDYENELPITQYFESARQAGLIRFSNVSDSEECHIYAHAQAHANIQQLYALHFHHCNNYKPPKAKARQAKENRMRPLKAEKRSKKEDYQIEPPKPSIVANKNTKVRGGVTRVPPTTQKKNAIKVINVKAVDEDLYKISPELLRSCKRKKRLGFFLRCLVPACMV